jgi:hypothetical protein
MIKKLIILIVVIIAYVTLGDLVLIHYHDSNVHKTQVTTSLTNRYESDISNLKTAITTTKTNYDNLNASYTHIQQECNVGLTDYNSLPASTKAKLTAPDCN